MGLKSFLGRSGDWVGNSVARLSALSPDQVNEIQAQRERYFEQLSRENPNDPASVDYTKGLLAAGSVEIFDAYLSQIQDLYAPVAKEVELDGKEFKPDHNMRFLNITKWVTDREENSLEKLINVYEVLSNEECNIALIFHRAHLETHVYLAVSNHSPMDDNINADHYIRRLAGAVKGNFPGAEYKEGTGVPPCLDNDRPYSVAAVSNIPTEKSGKFISQTVEKLLDGIVPESREQEYTLILLATPVPDVEAKKLRLSELYSGLAPYASWQTNFTATESGSVSSNMQAGVNIGASAGIQNAQNQALTSSRGTTDSSSSGQTDTTGETISDSSGTSETETSGTTATSSRTTGTNRARTAGTNTTSTTGTSTSQSHATGTNTSRSQTEGSGDTVGAGVSASFNVVNVLSVARGLATSKGNGWNIGASGTLFGVDVDGGINGSKTATLSNTMTTGTNSGFGIGGNINYSHGWNRSLTELAGESLTDTATTGTSRSLTKGVSTSVTNGSSQTFGTARAESASRAIGQTAQHTVANATSQALTKTLGKAVTSSLAQTVGRSKGINLGTNFGVNFARSSSVTATVGKNEGLTQSYTNYHIKHALELLEAQMERLEQSDALGMWDFAAYVLSEDIDIANNAAHSYLALTQGEKSFMAKAAVNLWRGDVNADASPAKEICGYLRELHHPVFGLKQDATDRWPDYFVYPPLVTAATSLTGKELAYSLNFPKKSVAGLPVLECAEFGRNVVTCDPAEKDREKLRLGHIFHMNRQEEDRVSLSKNALTAHTFITGSTGAGKSSTVYQILDQAARQGVKFLVVEPAKGEYKTVLGGRGDVSVYGTNARKTPLLRLNPFSFPDDIHVLEHIDRLVEVFNACWPMYAAMPAVLKEAVEAAYAGCGWSLTRSSCEPKRYPTFADVLKKLPEIIDSSAYSKDTKGDYTGALVTRVKSLTNGINGLIFCSDDDICDEDLFDRNVIIDLSRVGSMETKALLMGILVIKLQEYRMDRAAGSNAALRHITVLEEAHNLLRRTSAGQSQEGANLQGKSVEMLANAIAEMRTYGEGFIIADQAPGLLDMAVIRNTNTKIIMRLPDESDRELVGRSAGLNDGQIIELAKLDQGVAAVFQNHWLEPVLCKVDKFTDERGFEYKPPEQTYNPDTEALFTKILDGTKDCEELSAECVDRLKVWIDRYDTGREIKEVLRQALEPQQELLEQDVPYLCYCLVKGRSLIGMAEKAPNPSAAQALADQAVADAIQVSAGLAARIRELVFAYAASQVRDDEERFRDLLRYGGIK